MPGVLERRGAYRRIRERKSAPDTFGQGREVLLRPEWQILVWVGGQDVVTGAIEAWDNEAGFHVALKDPELRLYQSMPGDGVNDLYFVNPDDPHIVALRYHPALKVYDQDYDRIAQWFRDNRDKGYDYPAILGFLARLRLEVPNLYVCSEALQQASSLVHPSLGAKVRTTGSHKITPGDWLTAPNLVLA